MDSSHSQSLPSGVVTFLLTDIEGSTRLWEREPDAMREALERHDAIVNEEVPRLRGHVVKSKGEGDSVFSVFACETDAVSAAITLQRVFNNERWVTSTPIRVRMAVHTGHVQLRDGDYYGPTVNRCARLRALAKGGQVLLSGVTAQLTQAQLPDAANLVDLGTHQLKDLVAPERVWQLIHPSMESNAAPAPRARPTAMPIRRAYKLTDQWNQSTDGREWGPAVKHKVKAVVGASDPRILCYASPSLALLLNPQFERYSMPRIWEAFVDVEAVSGDAIVACSEVATTRQVKPPELTSLHHARFAVVCALAAYGEEGTFQTWAYSWLAGDDDQGLQAGTVADQLETETRDADERSRPRIIMAASAARAAALVGEPGDQTSARAIDCAAEAIRIAMGMTGLDLSTLARQAVPYHR